MLDKKVIKAWTGHPHLSVINNHDDFDAKMKRVIQEISSVLGLPKPIETERKYIVKLVGDVPTDCIENDIVQTYLNSSDSNSQVRLRKRGWDGKFVYVHTTKKRVSDTEELVTERQINNSLYEMMLTLADPNRRTICKHRLNFIWQGQFFEIDTYKNELEGLVILEAKGVDEGEPIKFPPFIEVIEDITGNVNYYNHTLARKFD